MQNANARSNNTNKLSPQEPDFSTPICINSSNNTNKLSPQELGRYRNKSIRVQIIQINLVLKNRHASTFQFHPFK